ncbi:MAG: hypothetical protein LBH46_00940, partial [Rickettsiales bacterium]|nr:hypothetical protein [Rickettsiales bacterium]
SANSFAVDGTYVAGGVFTNISYTNSSLRKDKTNEVEATALFGLYGKGAFDNAGSLVKATDFVYGGLNASYSKEGDEKGTDVGVVLGYAANPTLKVYAEYSFGKREETGMKANVNTVNITTKLSF